MKNELFRAPDLGNPFQDCDTPKPIDFVLTQKERSKVASFAVHLERNRREANKRDADRDMAALGIEWTGGDAA